MSELNKTNKDEYTISLERQIGGYKAQNITYKKKLEQTRKEVLDANAALKEAINNLNEAKEALEVVKKEQKVLLKLKEEMSLKIDILTNEVSFYKANYEHFKSLKWYERIFAK